MNMLSKLFGQSKDFKALLGNGAVIVDVRSVAEFNGGHIAGAVNIPLDQLKASLEDIRKKSRVVITCCFSGMRSGTACKVLSEAGIEAYDGGGWQILQRQLR